MPGVADGAPVYLAGVVTPGGPRDLLIMTLKAGTLVALDADSGAVVWTAAHPGNNCQQPDGAGLCYTTSSPAVDPGLQYVYTYGLDGYVHKQRAGDGSEVTGNGWPVQVTLHPELEKGSSDLSIVTAADGTTYLYMTNAAYPLVEGSPGYAYQGHLTAINLANAATEVFNAACSDEAGLVQPGTPACSPIGLGIWARAGTVYDPAADRLYAVTGNGAFDPQSFAWGDSVVELNPDGQGDAGAPLDSYTPTNQAALNAEDLDLGSTAPAILPVPAGSQSQVQHLAVQAGKDGVLRLLDLDNLSGQGGPGHTGGELGPTIQITPLGERVRAQPAVWTNPADGSTWAFVATRLTLTGVELTFSATGAPSLQEAWHIEPADSAEVDADASPMVANNVVYWAWSGVIAGVDPTTGNLLWEHSGIGGIHWESPIVVGGTVYIADDNGTLNAFGLPASAARGAARPAG